MELKLQSAQRIKNHIASFNRTFMELKYRLPIHPDGSLLHSFNRTFMELKFQKISDDAFESKVLIVPLWN